MIKAFIVNLLEMLVVKADVRLISCCILLFCGYSCYAVAPFDFENVFKMYVVDAR